MTTILAVVLAIIAVATIALATIATVAFLATVFPFTAYRVERRIVRVKNALRNRVR